MTAHLRAWNDWWEELGPRERYLPAFAVAAYWPCVAVLGGFRADHAFAGLLVLVLAYGGYALQRVLYFLLPLVLTGVVYDLQRYYPESLRGRIRVAEPYELERLFFGVQTPEGVLTLNEWWQLHLHPILDVVAGFFYLVFIPQFVLTAAFFVFVLGTRGTASRSASFVNRKAPEVMWALLWLNVAGYLTHNVFPSAPPWYVADFGLETILPEVVPDPAGTARFDQILGIDYFSEFYGRSANAFGAIPSLHVAFSALALYYAFRVGALRVLTATFFVGMCFSAVYLNHHYVIDVVWGVTYALAVGVTVDLVNERRHRARQPSADPLPSTQ